MPHGSAAKESGQEKGAGERGRLINLNVEGIYSFILRRWG